MRRSWVVVWALLSIALVALSACLPPLPPPTYSHPAALIASATVTPSTVVAGQPLTLTVVASHESAITSIETSVTGPTHYTLPDVYGCSDPARQHWSGPLTLVTMTLSCTLPAIAGNGTWTAHVTVQGDDSPPSSANVPFIVAGGSYDIDAPSNVTDTTTTPVVVHPGDDVTLVVRLDEEHLPITVTGRWTLWATEVIGPHPEIACDDHPVFTPITARLIDLAVTCHVPPDAVAGPYAGPALYPVDPLGQQGYVEWAVTVAA